MRVPSSCLLGLFLAASVLGACSSGGETDPADVHAGDYPILFVTQVPVSHFDAVSSSFANHLPDVVSAPRGGDLYIRYTDGTLRNLTQEAGFGMEGQQGKDAIAVRDPSVHWSGKKAVFSMVVGAPEKQYAQLFTPRWQLFEIEGLGQGEKATITRIANQPAEYDNVSPIYGTDDRILFTSDRPRDGSAHLFPQLDEYESTPTVTGLWSLDPASGSLFLVNHTASGLFSPSIDSFGRVIFTGWDHLQRDQQADADRYDGGNNGAFDFADETEAAQHLSTTTEVFPEPRDKRDPTLGKVVSPHSFNHFFPWQINEDGSGEETVNHVGRHEFGGTYTDASFPGDPNLTYSYATPEKNHANRYYVSASGGFFQMREDPSHPGTFYATNAQEFGTDCAGGILKFDGSPDLDGDAMVVTPVTAPVDRIYNEDSALPDPTHTGHFRNPLPLSDGTLVVAHTDETRQDKDDGTLERPAVRYAFRLKTTRAEGQYLVADRPLTPGIKKSIVYWNPDVLVSYDGPLWELSPVEVRERPRPVRRFEPLEAPEAKILSDESVDEAALRKWLTDSDLSLIVSRNVTSRDRSDLQQPYNLSVPGGVKTIGKPGKVYDVAYLQIFQADQLRGYGTHAGRRAIAVPLHDGKSLDPSTGGQPGGSVVLGTDGSMAAFVPARRALTWQLTAPDGAAVVRERNWLSFAPGEIRTCAVCHGLNTQDQSGAKTAENPPEALRTLLQRWKELPPGP
jgi:hydrazine synthase alpha subunit-like protein